MRLRCKALGEKPLSVSWSHDRQAISADSEPRFVFEEDQQEEFLESTIVLSAVQRQDSGLFSCQARNDFGKDVKNFQLLVQGDKEARQEK